MRVLVLSRQIQRRLPVFGSHVRVSARSQQQIDHRRIAKIDRSRVEQRRESDLVGTVYIGPARDQQLRDLHLVSEHRSIQQRNAAWFRLIRLDPHIQELPHHGQRFPTGRRR